MGSLGKVDETGLFGHITIDMPESVSRREVLSRLGATGATLATVGLIGRAVYDRGGYDVSHARGERQTRDFTVASRVSEPKFAIAKSTQEIELLVRRAVNALGGMKRFISRGDIVAIKPNIGWDRLPVHAANTNPLRRR